jgi:hypothetical protein
MPYSPQNSLSHANNNGPVAPLVAPVAPSAARSIAAQLPWMQIILAGGVVVGGYYAVHAVGQKFGLVKDKDKVAASDSIESFSLLKPGYYDKVFAAIPSGTGLKPITEKDRAALADNIYNAKGFFKDNKDAFWQAINALRYQIQLSVLADAFARKYGKDLGSFLATMLDADETKRFMKAILALPTGYGASGSDFNKPLPNVI